MRFQHRPYFLWTSGERSYLSYFLRSCKRCSSQYCPSVRLGQPGKAQGRFGFVGTVFLLPSYIRKAFEDCSPKARLILLFADYTISHIAGAYLCSKVLKAVQHLIFIGFSGKVTWARAEPCHLLTVDLSALSSSPISSQVMLLMYL